jgi:methylisocitrate lyase
LRLALKAVEDAFREMKDLGTQQPLLDKMQHRSRLYELVRYKDYNEFDQSVYNFTLKS